MSRSPFPVRPWHLGLMLIVLAASIPLTSDGFLIYNASLALTYAITLIGLNLLTGLSGQISLGHGAFMAVGAYTAALLHDRAGVSPYLGLVAAVAVAVLLGAVIGVVAARLRGLFLGLTTFGLAVGVPSLILQFDSLTGGAVGATSPHLASPLPGLDDEVWMFYLALLLTVGCLFLYRGLARRRDGRAWRLLSSGETAAQAVGIDVKRYKIKAFVISSGYAGLAGGMLGSIAGFISPDVFGLGLSISLFVGLVIGGTATLLGPVVGGAVLVFLPVLAQEGADLRPDIIYGILLVVIVMVAPDGICGGAVRLSHGILTAVRSRREASGHPHSTLVASASKE